MKDRICYRKKSYIVFITSKSPTNFWGDYDEDKVDEYSDNVNYYQELAEKEMKLISILNKEKILRKNSKNKNSKDSVEKNRNNQ